MAPFTVRPQSPRPGTTRAAVPQRSASTQGWTIQVEAARTTATPQVSDSDTLHEELASRRRRVPGPDVRLEDCPVLAVELKLMEDDVNRLLREAGERHGPAERLADYRLRQLRHLHHRIDGLRISLLPELGHLGLRGVE